MNTWHGKTLKQVYYSSFADVCPVRADFPQFWKLIHHAQFHTTKLLIEDMIKVSQMAQFISEGTLKMRQKKASDAVAADEEVATI